MYLEKGVLNYYKMTKDNLTFTKAKEERGNKILCAPKNTYPSGTAILLNIRFEFTLYKTTTNDTGNYTITELQLHRGISLILGFIYCQNQDNPFFTNNIMEIIQSYENSNILLEGDWSTTR